MRILLIEDDPILGDGIATGLRQAGNAADWFRSAEEGTIALRTESYSALVLDIGLPGMSGLQMLAALRRQGNSTPMLLLTARDTVKDRVDGLNTGADDYLVKPFDLMELVARLHALTRRAAGLLQPRWMVRDIEVDTAAHACWRAGVAVDLTRREFAVLLVLAEHVGAVLSRDRIEQALYTWGEEVQSNAIEVHIHHLRRKLGNDLIRTVRGVGYVIDLGP